MGVGDDTENITAFALNCFGHALPTCNRCALHGTENPNNWHDRFFFVVSAWGKNKATRQASGYLSNLNIISRISTTGKAIYRSIPTPISILKSYVQP
jgi:hypothetical protein